MTIIPATTVDVLISVEYPANGLDWARLYDNPILGWNVDDSGAVPPKPIPIGSLPTAAPATAPILSPQWATYSLAYPTVLVPDQWRGSFSEFLTWLATNNGAHRPLESRFRIASELFVQFNEWALNHSSLVHSAPPSQAL